MQDRYVPKLEDLPDEGYQPSLEDLPPKITKTSAFPFWESSPSASTTLVQQMPELRDPRQVGKAALQAAGVLGSALVPGLPEVMEGAGLLPGLVNAFSKIGAGAGFGAMASPEHPIIGAATGAVFPAVPGVIGKAANIFEKYFTPEQTAQNLISKLGFNKDLGRNQSIVENINELSRRLGFGQASAKEQALIPKRDLMAQIGDKNIVDPKPRGTLTSQALMPEQRMKGNYLSINEPDKYYSGILQDAHDNYVNNPTFANSDKLRSKLFDRINELSERKELQTITDNQEKELNTLRSNRSAIIKDQDNFINTLSPENQQKYSEFNRIWREDVTPYDESGNTIRDLKNGSLENVTPEKITNAFSFPELKPQLQKALKDIGPSGINNIVYNEIARTPSAKGILNTLNDLENHKGFAPYLTNEVKNLYQQLKTQLRNRNALLFGIGGIGSIGAADLAYHGAKNVLNAL